MGFTSPRVTLSVEKFISPRIQSCRVQEFISSTPNIGAKKSKLNRH